MKKKDERLYNHNFIEACNNKVENAIKESIKINK